MYHYFYQKTRAFLLALFISGTLLCGAQTMTLNLVTPVCPNGSGSAQVSFTGMTYPFTLYWYGSNISQSSAVITSSTQTITINGSTRGYGGDGGAVANFTHNLGSFGAFPVGITYDQVPFVTLTCSGGSLNINNIKGGTGPYTLKIFDNYSSNAIDSGASPISLKFNPICTNGYGNIRVLVKDSKGCYASIDSLRISCSGLDITSSTIPANCANGSASIDNVTGGVKPYTYSWSNGANSKNISGLSTDNYKCTITDSTGCANRVDLFVPQNPIIDINVTSSPANCNYADGAGAAFPIGGASPYTYLWDNSATTQSTNTLTGGPHTVIVTDANGCSGRGVVDVVIKSPVNVTYSRTSSSCTSPTGSAVLFANGGTAPYTYLWCNLSSTTASVSNLAAGNYSFIVTDANGCKKTGYVEIAPVSKVFASVSINHAICPNTTGSASLSINGSAPPYTYLWSNGATGTSINGVSTGGYSCLIKDANQCESVANVNIGQNSPVNVGIQSTISSCLYTADGAALATAFGGTPPYQYKWSTGISGYKINNLMTGSYDVYVKDANGCGGYGYTKVDYDPKGTSCFCTITGKVFNDLNGNCTQDANEPGIPSVLLNTNGAGYIQTNQYGDYSIRVKSGTYTLEQILPPFTKLANCQSNKIVINASAANNCVHVADFADSQTMFHDIQVFTSSLVPPIPGNDHLQKLIVINNGNYPETNIDANYAHDGVLTYLNSNPAALLAPNSSFPNNYSLASPLNINPGESNAFTLGFYTPKNLTLGTELYMVDSAAHKSPVYNYWITDEETPWNNRHDYYPVVVSSYDPNYKEVYPKGEGEAGIIDLDVKSFRYTIHFENNGTANAQKVVVIDTLDADLDIESFKTVYSSHDVKVQISTGRVVTFTFDHINLEYTPVGVYNAFAQGMVAFTINAKTSSVKEGTKLASNSGIYFDYNAPVFTNTPVNNYLKSLSVNEAALKQMEQMSIYPNPTGNTLNIKFPESLGSVQHIEVLNMQGQLVLEKDLTGNDMLQLDVTNLISGIYYLRVTSETGVVSGVKFIKI